MAGYTTVIIETQVKSLETLAGSLAGASSFREKVRLADQIFAALAECEKLVEQFIVADLSKGGTPIPQPAQPPAVAKHVIGSHAYKDMPLADIAHQLLTARGTLHGKEIEKLAKAGGFKGTAKSFQSYLSVALKRKGGFRNTGMNTWILDDSILPSDRDRAIPEKSNQSLFTNVMPRKTQLHEWLKQHNPSTRAEIMSGSGLPAGSASSILSVEKDLFRKDEDGRWHAL